MNYLRKLILCFEIVLSTLEIIANEVHAQAPFFAAKAPPKTYTLETRLNPAKKNYDLKTMVKTFQKRYPIFGYVGKVYDGKELGSTIYGAGPILNFKDRFYAIPSLDGVDNSFIGGTFYTTTILGKGYHIDLFPRLNEKGNYTFSTANIGKSYKGYTFGVNFKLKNNYAIDEKSLRIARANKGNFVTVGLGRKGFYAAFQKTF